MLLEFAIGQKMRCTALKVWKDIHPALFGVGIGCILVSLLLCMYYIIVIAWCLFYLFISMQKNLPWASEEVCGNKTHLEYAQLIKTRDYWNSNYTSLNISDLTRNYSRNMYYDAKQRVDNYSSCCVIDPPQWYFYTKVLDISTDIEDYSVGLNGKLVGCLALAWLIVYLCVVKGIKSSGKVNKNVLYYCCIVHKHKLILTLLIIKTINVEYL